MLIVMMVNVVKRVIESRWWGSNDLGDCNFVVVDDDDGGSGVIVTGNADCNGGYCHSYDS